MSLKQKIDIEEDLLAFETLAYRLGFKRTDGQIYGLLVLSETPLSSEEVEKALGLSQSAVSMALKKLADFKAIVTTDDRLRRCKVHTASSDSLALASNIFRKREQQDIEDFKFKTQSAIDKLRGAGEGEDTERMRRLKSMVSTCDIADAIMKFVIAISQLELTQKVPHFATRLPQLFELVLAGTSPLLDATTQFKNTITNKINMSPLTEKIRGGITHFFDGNQKDS